MLRLTGNKCAIQAIFDPDRTPSGLWIPDVAKDRCDQGLVKYVGPDVKDVKPGDYVLFGGYDGTTLRLEDEGVLILMRESAIKCIIDNVDTNVPGLYFKDRSGEHFPATYEMAIQLITQAFSETQPVKHANPYDVREDVLEVSE